MKVRLVICRHTQTDDNVRRIYTGQNDVLLNEQGIKQAESLAERLSSLSQVCAIYSSDLSRTRMVTELIARRIDVPVVFSADLREIDVGKMAGLAKDQAERMYQDSLYRVENPLFDFRPISGEDWKQVLFRYHLILDRISMKHGMDPHSPNNRLPRVVVVGHGSAFRRVFIEEHHAMETLHTQGDYQECVWPSVS